MSGPDIFLSYNREDQATAQRFAVAFQAAGFSVWWDAALHSGEAYDQVTEEALRSARAVVVLWSKRSVASRWVRAEATLANRNQTLVPVMIEPCERPIMFELTHTADLSHWQGSAGDPVWQAFLADVRRFVQNEARPQDSPKSTIAAPRLQPRTRVAAVVGLAVVLAIGLVLYFGQVFKTADTVASGQAVVRASEVSVRPGVAQADLTSLAPSIAVLPFANMSGDPEQEYFADGVAEEILNALSRISQLQVRGRTSSFYFKGRNEDLQSIAAQLNVDHILEGSVRKDGDKVRITVQLIHVPTDVHLWSKTYDRVLDDIFEIQEEIAGSVAATLEISLGVGELGSEPGMTRDVRAYELLLEARKQRSYTDRNHNLRAIEILEQAVEVDPQFALAWAMLANMYSSTGRYFIPDQTPLYQQRAEAALARAEQLAPELWSVLIFHNQSLQAQFRWQQAEEIIQRLTSGRSTYHIATASGFFEANIGHPRAALNFFEAAARAEPLNLSPVLLVAGMYAQLGDYEAAQATYAKAERLPVGNPSTIFSGEILLAMASHDSVAVKRSTEKFLDQSFNSVLGKAGVEIFAAMHSMLDSPQAALDTLRRFSLDPGYQTKSLLRSHSMAIWAAYFGDPQFALDMQYVAGKPAVYDPLTLWDPLFAEVRRLPGFRQLVTDIGLVEYWRSTGNWGDFCKPVGDDDFECH